MIVVLFAASSLKRLIICFSLASLVGTSGSSYCVWQAGSTWCCTQRLSSQIGGYRLASGCLKSFTKDSTRSSSSSFGQFGSSEMVIFFVRKVSRFSTSSLILEMKPLNGLVLAFWVCQSCCSRNASLFFLLFLGSAVPAASAVEWLLCSLVICCNWTLSLLLMKYTLRRAVRKSLCWLNVGVGRTDSKVCFQVLIHT
jgi:hypothetical protein